MADVSFLALARRHRVRLLIVEDSALIRKVTRLAFPSREHELQGAENGVEALAILDAVNQPFDAILLDLQMPSMNGWNSSAPYASAHRIVRRRWS